MSKPSRFTLRIGRNVTALAVFSTMFVMSLVVGGTVAATPNISPDPDYVPAGNNIAGYMVSRAPYIDIPATHLKIYSQTPDIAVFVASADLCRGAGVAGVDDVRGPDLNFLPDPTPITRFTLGAWQSDLTYNTVFGDGLTRTLATCDNNRPLTQWPADGAPKSTSLAVTTKRLIMHSDDRVAGRNDLFQFTFRADWWACNLGDDCGLNAFRLKVLNYNPSAGVPNYGNGSNIWVSQDTAHGADKFGISPGATPDGNFFTYQMFYAPDCTQSEVNPAITIYDDDNNLSQPTTQPEHFKFRIERKLRGTAWPGQAVWIDNSAVTSNALQHNFNTAVEADGHIWHVASTSLSKRTIRIDVNINPDYVYRVIVKRVFHANNLQMQLPYPSFWVDNRCQTEVSPTATLSPSTNVSHGQTITPSFIARDNNAGRPYDGSVRYRRTTWFSNNAASTAPGPGELIREDASFQGPVTVPGGGSVTIPNTGWNFTANSAWGYMCVALELQPANSDTTTNPARRHNCYPISQYPALSVTRGDIRTGGNFPANGGSCEIETGTTNAYDRFNIIGHNSDSRGQYGVTSLGYVKDFASDSTGPGGLNVLTYANDVSTTSNGLFRGTKATNTTYSTYCLNDVFAPGRYPPSTVFNHSSGSAPLLYFGAGEYTHTFTGSNQTLTIPAMTLGLNTGVTVRVIANGQYTGNRVVLTGDIKYVVDNVTILSQLPRFALLVDGVVSGANTGIDIVVADNVKRLDGVFANRGSHTGTFFTCASITGASSLVSKAICNNPLRVNGSLLLRGSIKPYRTAGDVTTTTAETFNMRPDIILRDAVNASTSTTLRTIEQKEVAPRY